MTKLQAYTNMVYMEAVSSLVMFFGLLLVIILLLRLLGKLYSNETEGNKKTGLAVFQLGVSLIGIFIGLYAAVSCTTLVPQMISPESYAIERLSKESVERQNK